MSIFTEQEYSVIESLLLKEKGITETALHHGITATKVYTILKKWDLKKREPYNDQILHFTYCSEAQRRRHISKMMKIGKYRWYEKHTQIPTKKNRRGRVFEAFFMLKEIQPRA